MTFAEPVAALGEHSPVPAHLKPEVPGQWRLAGPKTLVFEARERLPGSTVYQVQALGQEWSFSTTPVRLERVWPKGSKVHSLDIFVLSADQAIDPEAVLAGMELQVEGQVVPLLLASDEQIRSVRPAWARYRRLLPGQRLAVRPQHPLPEESRGVLLVRSGIPSLEGPLVTRQEQDLPFQVLPPFRLESARFKAGRFNGGNLYMGTLRLSFSHPLKTSRSGAD